MTLDRHRAAGIHLLLSASIVVTVLTLMLLQWYPDVWFGAMGGRHLLLILAGVDIVVGPLLTWIVFKPGKKTLRFDLSVIAALQLAALLYGLQVLYAARPAFIVFIQDRFRAVSAAEVDPVLQEQSPYAEFRVLPTRGPRIAAAELPRDPGELQKLKYAALHGIDLHLLPQFWVPYDGQSALRQSTPLEKLREIDPANAAAIDDHLLASQKKADQLRFLPLQARNKEMAILLDSDSGDVAGIIDAKPWR